jgi:sulfite reductase (NADPH) hemoprotein beta-component
MTKPPARSATTAPRTAAPVILTANRLRDGRVVWLAADGSWSESCSQARIFGPEEVADGLAAAAGAERAQHLVGAYAVDVAADTGRPLRLRERLRAKGPSVDAEPRPVLSLAF